MDDGSLVEKSRRRVKEEESKMQIIHGAYLKREEKRRRFAWLVIPLGDALGDALGERELESDADNTQTLLG